MIEGLSGKDLADIAIDDVGFTLNPKNIIYVDHKEPFVLTSSHKMMEFKLH